MRYIQIKLATKLPGLRSWLAAGFAYAALLVVVFVPSASAISDAQSKLFTQGIYYFNAAESCTVPDSSTSLTGSDNIQKIFNFFVQKGLSPAAAAGILGNIQEESHFNPAAEQSPGAWQDMSTASGRAIGLVQWDGGRRPNMIRYAQSKNVSPKGLAVQLDYIWLELTGDYKDSTLAPLKTAATPDDAAFIFHKNYEGSADSRSQIQERLNDAVAIFKQYSGSSPVGGGTTVQASSSGDCNTDQGAQFAGTFPFYSQCDPRWKDVSYAGDNMCGAGCGPSAMAMIITALTGIKVTPDVVAEYYTQNHYSGDFGTSWVAAPDAAKHWRLRSTALGTDIAKVTASVKSGSLVIMAGRGGLPFTSGGHFVVVRAVTSDGQWLLGDSATSDGHSNSKPWDPTIVMAGVVANGGSASVYAISK